MGGMPSARGCEWKGQSGHKKFQEAFEKLPRNPDGTLVYEAEQPNVPANVPFKAPATCGECSTRLPQYIGGGEDGEDQVQALPACPDDCANGSEQCLMRLSKWTRIQNGEGI